MNSRTKATFQQMQPTPRLNELTLAERTSCTAWPRACDGDRLRRHHERSDLTDPIAFRAACLSPLPVTVSGSEATRSPILPLPEPLASGAGGASRMLRILSPGHSHPKPIDARLPVSTPTHPYEHNRPGPNHRFSTSSAPQAPRWSLPRTTLLAIAERRSQG